jgi:hypothetical protein
MQVVDPGVQDPVSSDYINRSTSQLEHLQELVSKNISFSAYMTYRMVHSQKPFPRPSADILLFE